jgi:hypothetical protein
MAMNDLFDVTEMTPAAPGALGRGGLTPDDLMSHARRHVAAEFPGFLAEGGMVSWRSRYRAGSVLDIRLTHTPDGRGAGIMTAREHDARLLGCAQQLRDRPGALADLGIDPATLDRRIAGSEALVGSRA